MGIALIEQQFTQFAAFQVLNSGIVWPIRWPNENWPHQFLPPISPAVTLSPDNVPLDSIGQPAPFIEAEVIAGLDSASIAPTGSRYSQTIGLFRLYLIAQQGAGRADINTLADYLHDKLKRTTIYIDNLGNRLTCMDPRIDDNIAEHNLQTDVRTDALVQAAWKGARYIRMISTPWFFDYYS